MTCVVCGSPLPHRLLHRPRHALFWTVGVLVGRFVARFEDVTEEW